MKTERKKVPIRDRFWRKVDVRGAKDCWPMLKDRYHDAHACLSVGSGYHACATRIAYALSHGMEVSDIDPDMRVFQTCGNSKCVNPAHLVLLHHSQIQLTRARPLHTRFWERVVQGGPDECWKFTAYHSPRGVGLITGEDRRKPKLAAYRVAYCYANGLDPEKLDQEADVEHTCGNIWCVNPKHVYLANTRGVTARRVPEARRKARATTGAQALQSAIRKLSDDQVRRLREWYMEEDSDVETIAAHFQITAMTVTAIATYNLYRNVR